MSEKQTTYKASLCNSAGELDSVSADNLKTLTHELIDHLYTEWTLTEGDTIIISAIRPADKNLKHERK